MLDQSVSPYDSHCLDCVCVSLKEKLNIASSYKRVKEKIINVNNIHVASLHKKQWGT